MTGVIAVMKSSLESRKMYISRVFLGSVVASAAMSCVLSLSAFAMSSGVDFTDKSNAEARCCSTPAADLGQFESYWAAGSDGGTAAINYKLNLNDNPSGAKFGLDTDRYRRHDNGRESGNLAVMRGGEDLSVAHIKLAGTTLTPESAPVGENTTASENPVNQDTSDGAEPAQTNPDSSEFSGSSAPAGPDLGSVEEKDLISGGWK